MMKTLRIGFGTLLVLTMVTSVAKAQRGPGNEAGQGRGAGGPGTQTRGGHQGQTGQPQRGNKGHSGESGNPNQQSSGVLSTDIEGLDLLRMREEEKLARDVYTSLAKTSMLTIFGNISHAEGQHMQSIERLIRSGGAKAVNLNDTPGVFDSPKYQQLYATLIASGSRSPQDALKVGAKIEEMDIADLKRFLTQTTDPQVRQVLTHLMQGSQNHLRAFASQLAKQGLSYRAEFLTQAEFDQIANSSGQGSGQQSTGRGSKNGGQASNAGCQQVGSQHQGNGGQGLGEKNRGGQGNADQGGRRKGRGS